MLKLITSILILNFGLATVHCQTPTPTKGDYELNENEYLALEGGSMLPTPEKTSQVAREISAIREKFPAIREIKHNRKWVPGQVITTRIGAEQLQQLNNSAYGPLKHIEKIDLMPFFFAYVLTFGQPYSPPVLAEQIKKEFGVQGSPNTVYYEYEVDNITYKSQNQTYVFKKGTGACKESCPDRYLWEFRVGPGGEPELVKEWVVPQDGQRVIIY